MTPLALALTALGVSADAFAVAVGKGLGLRRLRLRDAVAIAATFGLFQALMPLIGWAVGTRVAGWVEAVDHWIAFGLLAFVGGSMLLAALRGEEGDEEEPGSAAGLGVRELLVLGVATSIDALAVGISLAFVELDIWATVATIGVTTFLLSLAGVYLGHRVGARFARPAEIAGGVVLIGIGVKILLDHLTG